jgi:hypothetical protein
LALSILVDLKTIWWYFGPILDKLSKTRPPRRSAEADGVAVKLEFTQFLPFFLSFLAVRFCRPLGGFETLAEFVRNRVKSSYWNWANSRKQSDRR